MTTAIATTEKFSTREEWLVAAIEALGKTVFADAGVELPPVRVSVGWPGGRGQQENVVGQCWPTGLAADKKAQLFISPVLNEAARVLDVLTLTVNPNPDLMPSHTFEGVEALLAG